MRSRHAVRLLASLLLLLAVAPTPAGASPRPAADDDDLLPRAVEPHDADAFEPWDSAGSSLWLAFSLTAQQNFSLTAQHDGSGRSFGGLVLLGLPLDRLSRRESPRSTAARAVYAEPPATPALKPAERPRKVEAPPAAPTSDGKLLPPPGESPPAPLAPLLVSIPAVRAAVRAALQQRRLLSPDTDLDALASRARSSALLPELRLRATRLVDEAQNLSPTEYDPTRTTASGGTSLWLEARATFRLDRLVFADEEVAIERMRRDRAEEQRKVAARVIELLFAWQRALARAADPKREGEQHATDALDVVQYAAELDLETDGWFSRWRGDAP